MPIRCETCGQDNRDGARYRMECGSELVGSLDLDCDRFEITRIRYIRIKNRGTRPLYPDVGLDKGKDPHGDRQPGMYLRVQEAR